MAVVSWYAFFSAALGPADAPASGRSCARTQSRARPGSRGDLPSQHNRGAALCRHLLLRPGLGLVSEELILGRPCRANTLRPGSQRALARTLLAATLACSCTRSVSPL